MSDPTATADSEPATEVDRDGETSVDREPAASGLWHTLAGFDRRWFELVFYLFLLVWMVGLLIVAWEWTWRDKLIPYITGVPTIAFILVRLVAVASPETYRRLTPTLPWGGESAETTEGGRPVSEETAELEETLQAVQAGSDVTRPRREQIAYGVRMIAWAMALPLLMYVIGFSNALVLFVLAFGLRFYDSTRDAVLVTVGFSAFMYLFFYYILGMQPWTGILDIPSIVEVVNLD